MMNSKLSSKASGSSVLFRLFVGLAALASGVMLWLWAGQQDHSWKYAPAIFCFSLAVAMCLPTPTGRVREMLSRSVGAVMILIGAAAAISVMLSRHGAEGLSVGKFVVGLVLAGIVIAIGWGQLFPNHYAPIPIDHDDPLVREANEQARREIGRFREGVEQGRKQAFAKFPMKAANGETEHIWGIVHSIDGDIASVSLVNTPVNEPEQKDPRFSVAIAELEDWMLTDQSELVEGGYTHLALARIYRREKGYVPRVMKKDLERFRDLDVSGV